MQIINTITGSDGNIKTDTHVSFDITTINPTSDCSTFADSQILQCNVPNVLYGNPKQYLIKGSYNSSATPRILFYDSATNAWKPASTATSKAVASTQGIKMVVTKSSDQWATCDIYVALDDLEFNLIPSNAESAKIVTYVDSDINYGNFSNFRRWKFNGMSDEGASIVLGCAAIQPNSSNSSVMFLLANIVSSDTQHVQLRVDWWTGAVEFGSSTQLATSRLSLVQSGQPANPTIDERLTQLELTVSQIETELQSSLTQINSRLETIQRSLSQVSGVFVSR